MLGLKKKKSTWSVVCKCCGRPFPAPFERETLDDLTDVNAYQCPSCGETQHYAREDHQPAA